MTCAKRTVTCVIKTVDKAMYRGTNWCRNPQPVCPRTEGEGYEKCKTVCDQAGHAEEDALWNATAVEDELHGATAYVIGHVHVCPDCKKALNDAGITDIRTME